MIPAIGSAQRPILLIDDSHEDLFLTKRLLVKAGVSRPIVTVDGGEEAIVFLRASAVPAANELKPAIIFCDIRMPVRSGHEVLAWARSVNALRDVPFVMLTGGDTDEDRARARELGAADFVVKFPSAEAFRKLVDRLTNTPAPISAPAG